MKEKEFDGHAWATIDDGVGLSCNVCLGVLWVFDGDAEWKDMMKLVRKHVCKGDEE